MELHPTEPEEPSPVEELVEGEPTEAYPEAESEFYEEEAMEEFTEEPLAAVEAEDEEGVRELVEGESELSLEEEEEEERGAFRRETRQEVLSRLMRRLLAARERVHEALERVRDINAEVRDVGPRPPEKLKEQYQRAIAELSAARREENLARSELIQALSWRG